MKQFNPFQFLVAPQVIVDRAFVFCEGPHVTMSSLCVLSHVRPLRCVLAKPSVSLHSLSSTQSSSMSNRYFAGNGEHSDSSQADLRKI